jgi:hypothetical protein
MPICYRKETNEWELQDITPEEVTEILEIGKRCIVEGLAYRFAKFATYKSFLEHAPQGSYFQA